MAAKSSNSAANGVMAHESQPVVWRKWRSHQRRISQYGSSISQPAVMYGGNRRLNCLLAGSHQLGESLLINK